MPSKENRTKIVSSALGSNSAPEKKITSRVPNGVQGQASVKRHQSLPPLNRNKETIPTRIPLSPQKQSNGAGSKNIIKFFIKPGKQILLEVEVPDTSCENKENGPESSQRDLKDKPALQVNNGTTKTSQNGTTKVEAKQGNKGSKKEKVSKKTDDKSSQKTKNDSQPKVTEFFSIRRSDRKTAEVYTDPETRILRSRNL